MGQRERAGLLAPEVPIESGAARTKAALLETGERLFGKSGIDVTSTREVCREAGVHQDAIHYHFGTKDQLVAAILEAGVARLDDGFGRHLEAASAVSGGLTIPGLAAAAVQACEDLSAESGVGRHHLDMLSAVSLHPRFRDLTLNRPSPWNERMMAALAPLTPRLTEAERMYRAAVAAMILIQVMSDRLPGRPVDEWMSHYVTLPPGQSQALLHAALVGVLGGPPSDTIRRRRSGRAV